LELLAASVLIGLSLVIPWVIIRDASQGRVDLISTRNTFLIGFVYFQTFSGLITVITGMNDRGLVLNDPGGTGAAYALLCAIFVAWFLASYRMAGRFFPGAAIPRPSVDPSVGSLVFVALISLAIGLLFRFVLGYVPILGVITVQFAVGAFLAASCLMMVAWSRNFANPIVAIIAAGVVATSVAALLVNAFGRREILGVFMSMAWTLFFVKWRHMPGWQLAVRGAFWAAVTLGAVVVLSAARSSGEKERSVGDYLQAIGSLSAQELAEQVIGGVAGQFAGGTSMWIYETRPDEFPYQPLHSVAYVVGFPIPRQYWEGKPNSLGRLITQQSAVSGVSDEHSFGPGIIGHVANDYPPLSLPLYPFLLAVFFSYCDRRLRANRDNPLEVIVLGAGIAQIFAIPRGELGLFFINATGTMFGAWMVLAPYSRFVGTPADQAELPEN
jgi:hypothetical protein